MLASPEIGVFAVPFSPAIPGCNPVAMKKIPAWSCYHRRAAAVVVVAAKVFALVAVVFESLLIHLRSVRSSQREDIRRQVR